MTTSSILDQHPLANRAWSAKLAAAMTELAQCEQACLFCADSCLSEQHVEMLRRCIRTDLNCAAVCHATAAVLQRQSEITSPLAHIQLRACLTACQECADECKHHAEQHAHCRICREACLRCQEKCNFLLGNLSPTGPSSN